MSKHYIDNKRFEELISLYQEDPESHEDELFKLFILLIDNITNGFRFNVDADDAKQDCLLLVTQTIRKFKKSKGSAFNYFTTIIVNDLKRNYTKEKKYKVKIDTYVDLNKDRLI